MIRNYVSYFAIKIEKITIYFVKNFISLEVPHILRFHESTYLNCQNYFINFRFSVTFRVHT